ncbi:MAG: Hsp20/alpha crystallin family protein [Bacteroides sp.]|nr:Hsp20/alpha crystallin family protein [Bacteroides sp.]
MLARINRNFVPAYWDDFFNDKSFNGVAPEVKKRFSPAINVIEEDKSFRIEVAAPGVGANDFNIKLENDMLTISREQKENKEEVEHKYLRREFSYNSFKRSFQLPDTIDAGSISAKQNSGILTIELPKKAEIVQNANRQIEVESGKSKAESGKPKA